MTGRDLRATLRALGHTQESAADAIGVARQTVARWVAGDYPIPMRGELLISTLKPRAYAKDDDEQAMQVLLPLVARLIAE